MESNTSHHAHAADAHGHCCAHDHAAPPPAAAPGPVDAEASRFRIANMDCTAEESEIRHALDPIAGVRSLRFDLGQRTIDIAGSPAAIDASVAALRRVGFDPQPVVGPVQAVAGVRLWRPGAALLLALGAEVMAWAAPATTVWRGATLVLALLAVSMAGWGTYKKGLAALRVGRLNINALMTVAVTGALLIGQWPEAAMVMALYALAEWLEARAVDRARHAISGLLALAPQDAEVQQPDGHWARQPTHGVPLDAIVRLRPGERVPLDGTVTSGRSAVNQAPVTGESLPVDKAPGDPVYAGTINQAAALEFRVTALATDSTLARIIHAVEHAQGTRAPTQRWVDRFAAIYTPAVFGLALALALLAPLLTAWTWHQSVYQALVLLVIACPCALVISTPVTVVSGLAAAARRGILIKGGVFLEQARNIKAVALDKTGTLTEGRPRLVAFEPVAAEADGDRLTRWAKSLAGRSDHPVAKAIAAALPGVTAEVDTFTAVPGCGVQGRIEGTDCLLGNSRWIQAHAAPSAGLQARLQVHEDSGHTVTLLAADNEVLAICAVADTLRPMAAATVAELLKLGVRPVMLTGDNFATAQAIAVQAGVTELHANLMPEEKLGALHDLQGRLGMTAMVGDGINDAPALAESDLGFAMGGIGTHTAMEAADIVIMNDDLRRLPETLRLSQQTHRVLVQNIALALGIKVVFLGLALSGHASMWMAVFADTGASLLVVFNGLRLLRAGRGPSGG